MLECTNTRNSRGVCQHLEQTGKSDHYGPWHSRHSAPQMGPYLRLSEAAKKNCLESVTHCVGAQSTVKVTPSLPLLQPQPIRESNSLTGIPR